MTDIRQTYLANAAEARNAAARAELVNVRDKFLGAARRWEQMAELANLDLSPEGKRRLIASRHG